MRIGAPVCPIQSKAGLEWATRPRAHWIDKHSNGAPKQHGKNGHADDPAEDFHCSPYISYRNGHDFRRAKAEIPK
jgi:hypothetical protein